MAIYTRDGGAGQHHTPITLIAVQRRPAGALGIIRWLALAELRSYAHTLVPLLRSSAAWSIMLRRHLDLPVYDGSRLPLCSKYMDALGDMDSASLTARTQYRIALQGISLGHEVWPSVLKFYSLSRTPNVVLLTFSSSPLHPHLDGLLRSL